MAQHTDTEANLLQYGGGRMLFGQNLKVIVFFPINPPIIMQNGGQDTNLQLSPTIEQGGENDEMQAEPIQYTGGEDTV